jgi:hypothetical protein
MDNMFQHKYFMFWATKPKRKQKQGIQMIPGLVCTLPHGFTCLNGDCEPVYSEILI